MVYIKAPSSIDNRQLELLSETLKANSGPIGSAVPLDISKALLDDAK